MARIWRAFVEELSGVAGDTVWLSEEESHHLRKVLRLQPGEELHVFNGAGIEWRAQLLPEEGGRRKERAVELVERIEPHCEPALRIRLFQGLCRHDKMDGVIQQATELGVQSIHPWSSERVDLAAPKPSRIARWRRIAIESCKQCGGQLVPEIEPVLDLPQVGENAEGWLLDPQSDSSLRPAVCGPGREVWVAIGPEAGLAPSEVASAASRGWFTAGLGSRVLRTENAALVAASVLLFQSGDLGSG